MNIRNAIRYLIRGPPQTASGWSLPCGIIVVLLVSQNLLRLYSAIYPQRMYKSFARKKGREQLNVLVSVKLIMTYLKELSMQFSNVF